MTTNYRICSRCVMDTTAEEIRFDEQGVCSFCHYFDQHVRPVLERSRSQEGKQRSGKVVGIIKQAGKGKPYDSILGLSGGTDSSYLAYLATSQGLRPLVVHVDMGWNSETSERNVKALVSKLKLDLEIVVVPFEEMRDLQLAFYKASVKNCEIPQDHAFLAALYRMASEYKIRYILSGGNLATESILPESWGYNTGDLRHILAIHHRFGTRNLHAYPMLGFYQRYLYYPFVRGIRELRLLNYIPYKRSEAKVFLSKEFGWEDYGAKHFESVLTRFFQGYYLPTKFGIDKRKAHFSSLILSGEMKREEALQELENSPYPFEQVQADKKYIADALEISLAEWEDILAKPPTSHDAFSSLKTLFILKDALVRSFHLRRWLNNLQGYQN